jgi:hypothetical protein
VLVYHPTEAEIYARLINVPRGRDVAIHVAATEAEAAVHIAQVEVIYASEPAAGAVRQGQAVALAAGHGRGGGLGTGLARPAAPRRRHARARGVRARG